MQVASMKLRWLLWSAAILGCQSRGPEYPEMDVPIAVPERAPSAEPAPREPATLYRDEVDGVVDAGLGYFLQHVEVDATLADGQF